MRRTSEVIQPDAEVPGHAHGEAHSGEHAAPPLNAAIAPPSLAPIAASLQAAVNSVTGATLCADAPREPVYSILLVDDSPTDRKAVRRALQSMAADAEIVEAETGRSALDLLEARGAEKPFDVALLDYRLPDLDGLEVVRAARSRGIKTPLIMLTGQGDEQTAVEMMKAGAADYLVKSRVSLDRLTQSVNTAVRVHRAEMAAHLADARLRESEERFREMAEGAPVMLWFDDVLSGSNYVNQRWVDFTGRPAGREAQNGWLEGVHPDDLQRCIAAYRKSYEARGKFEIEYRLRRHDGEYRWVYNTGAARFLADGRFAGYIGSCIDITERREAERQKAQLLEREREARAAAEAAQHRLEFLANASALMARSLNYRDTLSGVARLAVSAIADWCSIDLLAGVARAAADERQSGRFPARDAVFGGCLQYVKIATDYADASMAPLSPQFAQLPYRLSDRRGIANVIATGLSELYPHLTDAMLAEAAHNEEHLRSLRELRLISLMIVPLIARGQRIGAISLATAQSPMRPARVYGPADLRLAEDLARRAAAAIDNALLYQQMQQALRDGEEFSALLDTLLANAPVAMGFIDRDLRYVRVNKALADIHGMSVEAHAGKTIAQVVPVIAAQVHGHLRRTIDTSEPQINIEIRGPARGSGDAVRDWIVCYYPVRSRSDRLLGVGVTVVDITEQKRVQRELEESKENAEAANRAKDQFLAVLSHELRTPLAPVLSSVHALETEEHLPELMRPTIEMIRRNVELEARLIDDLLDLTRVSKGKLQLNLENADAHALLRNVIEICRSELSAKRQILTVELEAASVIVRADSARLQQIFWNLLKNAIKFTPEGGAIRLRSSNGPGGSLVIALSDTGIGIAAEALPRIFGAFEQGERSVTRRFGGLGLGLAIARALAEAHRGKLTVASAGAGQGSTFTLELPTIAAAVTPPCQSRTPQPRQHMEKVRILLVDDHADTSRAMKRLLERIGYHVQTAENCADAVQAAKAETFDLLVSDIGLPDGSGLDLVQRLREIQPVEAIALSGFGMDEDLQKSKAAGFAEHLTKPINFQRLEAAIQRLTKSGSADPENAE